MNTCLWAFVRLVILTIKERNTRAIGITTNLKSNCFKNENPLLMTINLKSNTRNQSPNIPYSRILYFIPKLKKKLSD